MLKLTLREINKCWRSIVHSSGSSIHTIYCRHSVTDNSRLSHSLKPETAIAFLQKHLKFWLWWKWQECSSLQGQQKESLEM